MWGRGVCNGRSKEQSKKKKKSSDTWYARQKGKKKAQEEGNDTGGHTEQVRTGMCARLSVFSATLS